MVEPVEQERMLAAYMFPLEWNEAATLTGKRGNTRRRNLRGSAVAQQLMSLLPSSARCGNCADMSLKPHGLICEVQSDFYGYVRTNEQSVCPSWRPVKEERG